MESNKSIIYKLESKLCEYKAKRFDYKEKLLDAKIAEHLQEHCEDRTINIKLDEWYLKMLQAKIKDCKECIAKIKRRPDQELNVQVNTMKLIMQKATNVNMANAIAQTSDLT